MIVMKEKKNGDQQFFLNKNDGSEFGKKRKQKTDFYDEFKGEKGNPKSFQHKKQKKMKLRGHQWESMDQ